MNPPPKHDPEALERRPEARAFKVEDLLLDAARGRVRVPPFQRGLRWTREDARKLLDSLYRGYPVGTLLFWEKAAEAGEIRLGSLRISGEARSDALWVVDGQQRIASLARVLLAETPDSDAFALYFDLDEQSLATPPEARVMERDPGRWLPMNQVLDAERLMQWLFEHAADRKERRERAIQLGRRIRDYEIPAYLVRTENEAILREVFGRINSSGKNLKADEVFDALHGAYRQASPATLKEVARDLEALGFGHVEEEKVLYRLLLATQGLDDVRRAGESLRLSPEEAVSAYFSTEQAARRAIQFIRDAVGIPHYELLPYKQPLVALGKFFHHYPEPSQRSRDLLARWVWRGALSGAHRGDTASAQATLSRIGRHGEEDSVQRLLAQMSGGLSLTPQVDQPFNFRSATSKLQALALLALGPLDLETGAPISPESLLHEERGRVGLRLPRLLNTEDHRPLSQGIANRLFHPGRNGPCKAALAVTDPRIAHSHGITPEAMRALRANDIGRFLELRAAFLADHFALFFNRHARWEESDRPSLGFLLIEDDDEPREPPR